MSVEQGELFSGAPRGDGSRGTARLRSESEPAPVWLQRLSLIVLVVFCFYIGGLLVILPWTSHYWNQNGWLMSHPAVYDLLAQGWMRGLVSGIGVLDVWIGISEIIHYRDYRP
jgi:hypothetical protein